VRKCAAVAGLALYAAGCTPTLHESLAVSCAEHVGRPISERIAALGPPKNVYRIDPTRIGYVFETTETVLVGGEPYYTVNYMIGADKHRTPIRKVTTICSGVFIVSAPSDATPVTERIVVDVISK
jgi:hypothetical protein